MKETTNPINNLTPVAELLAAGKALGAVINPGMNRAPQVLAPAGYELKAIPLETLPPLPDHIRQSVRLDDAESFVAYVKAFRTATTRIFFAAPKISEMKGAQFTALLDYHEGGKECAPKRVAHKASYPVPMSLEFEAWLAQDRKAMGQMDFVNFIEANCADIVLPASASLLELALNFESKSEVSFQAKVNRVTGGRGLVYQESVEAGAPSVGQMTVPEELLLKLAVFEAGKKYELRARLEYRPRDGRLVITYHLQRPQDTFRLALTELREEIAGSLELEILTGSPV